MKHEYVVSKILGSEHEHGSHYSTPCASYKVVCTCGHEFTKDTCFPPSKYPNETDKERMLEHRIADLEKKVRLLSIRHTKFK